jgi:F0F1-type ATP synthase membrane subunit b/b'
VDEVIKQLGIDGRLLAFQIVAFLITWALLKVLLFDRLRAHLAARRADEGQKRSAVELRRKEVDQAASKADARLAEIEKAAYERAQTEVRAGLKRKADAVAAAQDQARDILARTRVDVEKEHDRSLEGLQEQIAELAVFVASHVLERKLEGRELLRVAEAAVPSDLGRGKEARS